jgi:hypothetical protein
MARTRENVLLFTPAEKASTGALWWRTFLNKPAVLQQRRLELKVFLNDPGDSNLAEDPTPGK